MYENFVRQIAVDALQIAKAGESLKKTVARDDEIQALKKQIATLQIKIKKEKQLNKQMQMNKETKALKKLEEM